MSGIVGIWHRDGRPADRVALGRLCAALRHRGRDAEAMRIDGDAGVACCLARVTPESRDETQPVVDAGTMLVFDGRLDNRDDLIAALPRDAATTSQSPDSILALAAYRLFGDAFPARLNGDFALALFDRDRRRMLLARDAVGVRPLYFHASPHLFVFASEIKALLAHPDVPARPDGAALADFLFTRNAEQPPTSRTFFDQIMSVQPGHAVIVEADAVRTAQHWDFDVTRSIRFPCAADYADAFREHFDRAVRRRLRSVRPVAISVSGGLDSSAIFCAAHALASRERSLARPVGVSLTFPDGTPADEKAFLIDLERACGSSIVRLHDLPVGIMDGCRDAIWHAEAPYLDAQWNATHAQLTAVRQRGASVLLTGHWGDQFLFDDAYLIDLCRRGRWRTAWSHVGAFSQWMDVADAAFKRRFFASLLKYHVPATVTAALRQVRRRLRSRTDSHVWAGDAFRRLARRKPRPRARVKAASAHAASLYREVRSQYAVSCMERNDKIAAMHGLETAFPFLDRDVIAFLMAIPGDIQSKDGVPKALLRDAYTGLLPDAIARRASKADFTARANTGIVQDRPAVVEGLRAGGMTVARGYVRGEALDAIAAAHIDVDGRSAVTSWALADLFALELWLQEFVGPARRDHSWRTLEDAHAI